MALGDPYATLAQLKTYLIVTDSVQDALLTDALATSSRLIEHHCSRQFNTAGSASARVYYPDSSCHVEVADFSTTAGLVVKYSTSDDAVYNVTLTAAQYQLLPLNGVVDGESGWPYNVIVTQSLVLPRGTLRPSVEVTANWGWAAVPGPIKQACIYLAEQTYKLKGAPFGVAGFDQFGPVRVRDNPLVMAMLEPYRLEGVFVG